MIHEEITIAGKPVTLGYCYATEIAYKGLSGEDIASIIQDTIAAINAKPAGMPDVKRCIYLVLAAAMAYYQSKGEDEPTPIKDTDLMNEATPLELGTALGTIINLWAKFYNIPAGEPKDKPAKGKGKKGKN
ncbi:MAG: hypothetical protein IJ066_10870 [Bacteroidaceae bacterium]|nr:hypothetical protein [Bacteroidaceae bacterium]